MLAAISALPGPHGIGDVGPSARGFVDLLADAGQSVWQILPTLEPGNPANSPYDGHSSFAFNRWLIAPDDLVEAGLLEPGDLTRGRPARLAADAVDYGAMQQWKGGLLDRAADRLLLRATTDARLGAELARFELGNAHWLEPHLRFLRLKELHAAAERPTHARAAWPVADRSAATAAAVDITSQSSRRVVAQQFLAAGQWSRLQEYAASRGVRMMTDMPFYEGDDGVAVWKRPELFELDSQQRALRVGGAPAKPTAPQQVWGMPAYDGRRRAELLQHFEQRLAHEVRRAGPGGYVRIDHVLGAAEPFVVPVADGVPTRAGSFVPLFEPEQWNEMLRKFPDTTFVSEDRGQLTPRRQRLVDSIEGPRVRLAAKALTDDVPLERSHHFGGSPALLERDVLYVGSTHDDPFLRTLIEDRFTEPRVRELRGILHRSGRVSNPDSVADVARGYLQLGLDSRSRLTIAHVFDLLGMGGAHEVAHRRAFNVPGTVAPSNWATRIGAELLEEGPVRQGFVSELRAMTARAGRLALRVAA